MSFIMHRLGYANYIGFLKEHLEQEAQRKRPIAELQKAYTKIEHVVEEVEHLQEWLDKAP